MLYISAKDLLVQLSTEQILSKISNFNEIPIKSTYFENVYFYNIIYQEMGLEIFSYKFLWHTGV